MKLYLVRHGESVANREGFLAGNRIDAELTEHGREQAQKTAKKLKGEHVNIIYASPLKRAIDTARIIAQELTIADIHIDERLTERDDGVLTGKTHDAIANYAEKVIKTPGVGYFIGVEGSEEFPELYERAEHLLKDVQEKHKDPNNTVLLVTSNDIGVMILAAARGISWITALETLHITNAEIVEVI